MDKLLKAIGVVGLSLASIFYRLFVLTKVWLYTAVPLGAPQLSLWKMWGLSIFISCATLDGKSEDVELDVAAKRLLTSLVSISFAWLIAYLCFG